MGFDPALGQAFDFSSDDLEANRAGRLSSDQEIVWRNTVCARARGTRRGVTMVAVAVGGAAITAIVLGSRTPGTGAGAWVLVAVMLGLITVLAAGFMIRGHKGGAALATAELRVSEGPFSWSSDLNARWWGEVGDARFGMDRLQQERLDDGAVYRVWWLRLDGHAWVQSIERA